MAKNNFVIVEVEVGMYDLPRLSLVCEKDHSDIADVLPFILGEKVESTFSQVFGDHQ